MNVSLGSPAKTYDPLDQASVRRAIEQAFAKLPSLVMQPYQVADLPDASGPTRWIYVTDEAGGAVPAFNDGAAWRRSTDRAVVS